MDRSRGGRRRLGPRARRGRDRARRRRDRRRSLRGAAELVRRPDLRGPREAVEAARASHGRAPRLRSDAREILRAHQEGARSHARGAGNLPQERHGLGRSRRAVFDGQLLPGDLSQRPAGADHLRLDPARAPPVVRCDPHRDRDDAARAGPREGARRGARAPRERGREAAERADKRRRQGRRPLPDRRAQPARGSADARPGGRATAEDEAGRAQLRQPGLLLDGRVPEGRGGAAGPPPPDPEPLRTGRGRPQAPRRDRRAPAERDVALRGPPRDRLVAVPPARALCQQSGAAPILRGHDVARARRPRLSPQPAVARDGPRRRRRPGARRRRRALRPSCAAPASSTR